MSFHVKKIERYRVKPKVAIKLSKFSTQETKAFDGPKEKAAEELEAFRILLGDLQGLLYAEHKRKVLIVLQAMDTQARIVLFAWFLKVLILRVCALLLLRFPPKKRPTMITSGVFTSKFQLRERS